MPPKHGVRTLPSLPFDVYEHITQFLSDNDMWNLYTVNRAFYELSRRRRYKEATLKFYWKLPRSVRWSPRSDEAGSGRVMIEGVSLSNRSGSYGHIDQYDSEVIRYLHSFTLAFEGPASVWRPGVIRLTSDGHKHDHGIKDTNPKLRRLFPPLKTSLRLGESTLPSRKPAVSLESIGRFIESLSQVDHLTLTIKPPVGALLKNLPSSQYLQQCSIISKVVSACWKGSGANLRSLTVSVPIESWGLVIPVSLQLEHLEELIIQGVRRTSMGMLQEYDVHHFSLVPFIQNHSRTLRALTVQLPYDLGFFRIFKHLPLLEAVNIEEDCTSLGHVNFQGDFYHFLRRHCETVTTIVWNRSCCHRATAPGDKSWFDQSIHKLIPFPRLRVLELRNSSLYTKMIQNPHHPLLIELKSLLQSYSQTLTRLCLEGYDFSLGYAYQLLDTIASPFLEHLEVCFHNITRRIFATMANNLPYLQVLCLSYHNVGRQYESLNSDAPHYLHLWSNDDIGEFEVLLEDASLSSRELRKHYFRQDMRELYLPSWNLRELHLTTMDQSQSDWKAYTFGVGSAILRSLPSVLTLNSKKRECFVQ